MKKNKIKITNSFLSWMAFYVVVIIFFAAGAQFIIRYDFASNTIWTNILAIIFEIWLISSFVVIVVLFYIFKVRRLWKDRINSFSYFLITGFVVISLTISAVLSKYTPQNQPFDVLDRIMSISWTIFGTATGLYVLLMGFLSNSGEKNKEVINHRLSDLFLSLYPILITTALIIVSTLLLYCFYDNNPGTTNNFCYASLIMSIICVPYYLINAFKFSSKLAEDTQKE